MKISLFWIRALGLFGILGGLILFAGDLLFYYDSNSIDLVLNMSHSSDERIILSAITALFATWFYLLGTIHTYYAFYPSSTLIRNIVTISFSAIFIAYGIIHGAYVAIATSAKLALQHNIDPNIATEFAFHINNILRLFVYPFFAILSVVFITQVWKRKTLYPRWIIIFFPLIPFMLRDVFAKSLSGGLWIIFVGGFYNLILVLFFIASTIALWHRTNYDKNIHIK